MHVSGHLMFAAALLTTCREHASAFVAPSSSSKTWLPPSPLSARIPSQLHVSTTKTTYGLQQNGYGTAVQEAGDRGTPLPGFTPLRGIRGFLSKAARSGQDNRKMLRQNTFVILAGFALAFNSGFINGCCLSGVLAACGTGVPVAAFTGAYTKAGLAIGAGNYAGLVANAQMIASFMGGAALSGLMNPRPTPNRITPRYGPTFLAGSGLLFLSSVLATTRPGGRAFLYLAAMANGLQNAISSTYTGNLIRSSHMSGISSDIGMIFGQMVGGNMQNLWRFVVLSGLAGSFLVGGIISYGAVTRFKSYALSFSASLYFTIAMATIAFTSYQEHVSLFRAASGQWEWGGNEPPTVKYLKKLFHRHDADGSGSLNEDEFRDVLLSAGVTNISDVGFGAVFRLADVDGSNGVSMDELIGLVACDGEEECILVYPDNDEDEDGRPMMMLNNIEQTSG